MLEAPPHIDLVFELRAAGAPPASVAVKNGTTVETTGALASRFVLNGKDGFTNNDALWRVFEVDDIAACHDAVAKGQGGTVASAVFDKRAIVVEASLAAGVSVIRRNTDKGHAFRLLFAGPASATPSAEPVDLLTLSWFNPSTTVGGGLHDPSSGVSFDSALAAYDAISAELYQDEELVYAMTYALSLAHNTLGRPRFPASWDIDEATLTRALGGRPWIGGDAPAAMKEIFERLRVLNTA